MAPFNPPIKDQDAPKYGGAFHPIDVPENIKQQGVQQNTINPQGVQQGDLSAQYAGQAAAAGIKASAVESEGYADLFKNVAATGDFLAKAGVNMVKKDIEDKVYAVADKERQSYTDLLEKIKAGVGVKNVLDTNAADPEETSTPGEIAQLPDTLSALQGARDSGKISGTYYQSRLLAEAKNLRAQYPGFREEIDQQFAKVTGTNPANAYITSLVQDINRASAASASDKNKTLTFIRSNLDAFDNGPQVYQDYQKGLIDDNEVMKQAFPFLRQKAQLQLNNLKFTDTKNTREDQQRIAGENIDYASGMIVNKTVSSLMTKMGLNTAADVDKLIDMDKNGQIPSQQWANYNQAIATAKVTLRTQMIADADRLGYTKAAGGKGEILKRIDNALAPLDDLAARANNHDFGGMYAAKQYVTAMGDETRKSMLQNPKIGPYLQTAQALKEIGGEQNLQQFSLDAIKGTFPEDFKTYFTGLRNGIATQYSMRTTGVPVTFNDAIDDIKQNKVKNQDFNNAVLDEVKKIYNPNIPEAIRMNYAAAAFSPGNYGMISRLNADGVDAKGRQIKGQSAVFQNFTAPEMTKAMFELGKKDPQIWTNYVNWSKHTIANELMNQEINGLKNIPADSGVTVTWDPKNHRFNAIDSMDPAIRAASNQARGGPGVGQGNSYYNVVQQSVNRMNAQIYNFKRIAEQSGDDVDSFVLKTIADSAGPEALKNVQGIPYNIIRDMGLSRLKNGGK